MKSVKRILVEQEVLICDRCLKGKATHMARLVFTDCESGDEEIVTLTEDGSAEFVVCGPCREVMRNSRRVYHRNRAASGPTPPPEAQPEPAPVETPA